MSGAARVFPSQAICDCFNQRFVPALSKLQPFLPTLVLLITNPGFLEVVCFTPLKGGRLKMETGAGHRGRQACTNQQNQSSASVMPLPPCVSPGSPEPLVFLIAQHGIPRLWRPMGGRARTGIKLPRLPSLTRLAGLAAGPRRAFGPAWSGLPMQTHGFDTFLVPAE